ncbi:MAG: glyceraldehyde 3-phosphate dehydrogenase NAD-binding domain-containing protein, partial [Nanoarchaeota archaeon]
MKVAINGFGRIGRVFFREAFKRGVNIVAINDVYGVKDAAYLLKYDSVYGPYDKKIVVQGNDLIIEGKRIKVVSEREPEKLPWKQLGANVII